MFPNSRYKALALFAIVLLSLTWFQALFRVGADTDQGDIYRILFVHVPIAWCAFFWVIASGVISLHGLLTKKYRLNDYKGDLRARSSTEVGALFALLVLITGSIWGKPTWGVWWFWGDARLTTTLVMFLICGASLLLPLFIPDQQEQKRVSLVLSVINALNVPLVYFSVNIWRTLHQPQTFVAGKSSGYASGDIVFTLLSNLGAMFFVSIVFVLIRYKTHRLEQLGEVV